MKKTILILLFLSTLVGLKPDNNITQTDNIYTYDATVNWQKSNASDIQVFEPYIGEFRSESKFNEQLKKKIQL